MTLVYLISGLILSISDQGMKYKLRKQGELQHLNGVTSVLLESHALKEI